MNKKKKWLLFGGVTPESIFGSKLIDYIDGDFGVDLGTLAWTGQKIGSIFTAINTPTYNATLLNGHGGFSYVRASVQRHENVTLDFTAPSITPTVQIAVIRQNAWNAGASIIGASSGASNMRIQQDAVSPEIRENNTTAVNTNNGLAIATWGVVIAEYTNSVADRLICGVTKVTGANAGNNNPPAGRQISANGAAGHCSDSGVWYGWLNALGTDSEYNQLMSYFTDKYGAILVPSFP